VANAAYWDAFTDMQKTIKQRFEAAGLTIPFPQQTAGIRPVKSPDPKQTP
jgi:small-conductance mechanosensitive channel